MTVLKPAGGLHPAARPTTTTHTTPAEHEWARREARLAELRDRLGATPAGRALIDRIERLGRP